MSDGTNTLEFIYDGNGLCGVKCNNDINYLYRKNAQGDITHILDNAGMVVAKYVYDAWGNHAIVDANGNDLASGIGVLNPFRYRGYYYDTETDLYYLQTRYYDPEVGRFISQDDVSYLAPDNINGLNLYAYCANNPVMNVDPSGTEWWEWLLLGVASAFAVAFVVVGTVFTGGILGSVLVGAGMGFLGGVSASFVAQGGNLSSFDPMKGLSSGLIGAAIGAISGFFAGYISMAGKLVGQWAGNILSNASVGGLNIGQAFSYIGGAKMITAVLSFARQVLGGIVGGALGNKVANDAFGNATTYEDNIKEGVNGTIQDIMSEIIYRFFRWVKA